MNNILNENGAGIHGTIDQQIKKEKSFKMILVQYCKKINSISARDSSDGNDGNNPKFVKCSCVIFTHYGCSYTHFH